MFLNKLSHIPKLNQHESENIKRRGGDFSVIEDIGNVAGEIWHLLKERKELSTSGVVSEIKASQSTAYMALGWLAREG